MNNITYTYIETTNYCNLNCSFCNRSEVVKKLQHMSINDFKYILDQIKGYSVRESKLMGMGDPFLHPNYDKICKLFKKTFPNSKIISSTNCQIKINKSFQESLKYIDLLYFSIDGYEETYEKFRKNASWKNLLNFLDEFKKLNRYNCKIEVNYVINPDNIDDIQKVYDNIVTKYGIDDIRLNIAQNWSEDESIIANYSDEQIEYLKTHWKTKIKGKSDWDFNQCFWVNEGLYISVNGDVKVCRLNTTSKSIGNIFSENLETIKDNELLKHIRNGCLINNPTKHCEKCSYKELVPILNKILK